MGSFATFDRESNQYVGTLMIKPLPDSENVDTEDIEIGWHLGRSAWGKGFATEGGRKLLEIGFGKLKLDVIHAVVKKENIRSIKVTERLGMEHQGNTERYYGELVEHFTLTRDQWKKGMG